MADKVLRLTEVHNVQHEVRGQHVVLKIEGRAEGREVRVELPLTSWDTTYAVSALRDGVRKQAEEWQRAQTELGAGTR